MRRAVPAPGDRLALGPRLTVAEARGACKAVCDLLAGGARQVTLDVSDVQVLDAVGVAALLQCQRVAETRGAACTVVVGAAVERQLIQAKVVAELNLIGEMPTAPLSPGAITTMPDERVVVAHHGQLTLRQPRVDDLPRFKEWADDDVVEQMVGSDLLYRFRHLAPESPELLGAILYDPRGLTALVEALHPGRPVGFVRLYDVDGTSGFAFVETVVTDPRALRRGIGVEASRLMIAFAQDALRLRRVEAKVYAYNVRSINALRRHGFKQEGVLREARIYDGQVWDIFVFGLLEREMAREREGTGLPSFALIPAETPGP
jgi:RimJ/RimL family protein N-acetyltransferase/ABC-type transporter Mla MlaB component